MARWSVVRSLGLLVLVAAPPSRAGDKVEPSAPSPAQSPPDQLRADWRAAGLAAAPEMIAALCGRREWRAKVAGDELARHGPAAMLQLIRAAPPPRCQADNLMANIMCAGAIIEDGDKGQRLWDEALSALLAMNGSAERDTAFTGLSVLSDVAFRRSQQKCPAGDVVLARAMPTLAAWLRAEPYGRIVPSIAESVGPIAAPLVPDLIPLLGKGEPEFVARALGAIGPQAAPAVPALRAIFRRPGNQPSSDPRCGPSAASANPPARRSLISRRS